MFQRKSRSSSSSGISKPAPAPVDTRWYLEQFTTYADDDGSIGPEGVEKLCGALEVDPADVLVLVLAWQLGAAQMGYFSREEWSAGASSLGEGVQSEKELKERLRDVYTRTRRSKDQLRDLHRYTHKFCREERKKNIDRDSALAMLELLHGQAFPKHVPKLIEFIKVNETCGKRGISFDEWSMILNFCTEISADCSNYQDDGAWPLLLDEFVEYVRGPEEQQ